MARPCGWSVGWWAVVLLVSLSAPAVAQNLVINGSFEDPYVDSFQIFSSIPGWTLSRGCGIKIHADCLPVFGCGPAADGRQYVSLDVRDWQGTGCDLQSAVTAQDVATTPGLWYDLRFAFAPRPGTPAENNVLEVDWEGEILDTLTADGTADTLPQWKYFTYRVKAVASPSRLEFGARGISTTLGTYVDAVTLVLAPDPDGDGIPSDQDNCPYAWNPDQKDTNGNGIGDACDPDPYSNVSGLCPCDGDWANHDAYVACVVHATADLKAQALISCRQAADLRVAAAHSSCGIAPPAHHHCPKFHCHQPNCHNPSHCHDASHCNHHSRWDKGHWGSDRDGDRDNDRDWDRH